MRYSSFHTQPSLLTLLFWFSTLVILEVPLTCDVKSHLFSLAMIINNVMQKAISLSMINSCNAWQFRHGMILLVCMSPLNIRRCMEAAIPQWPLKVILLPILWSTTPTRPTFSFSLGGMAFCSLWCPRRAKYMAPNDVCPRSQCHLIQRGASREAQSLSDTDNDTYRWERLPAAMW